MGGLRARERQDKEPAGPGAGEEQEARTGPLDAFFSLSEWRWAPPLQGPCVGSLLCLYTRVHVRVTESLQKLPQSAPRPSQGFWSGLRGWPQGLACQEPPWIVPEAAR